MSGIPPQLDVHPGTPTGEWAVKTTSALQPQPAATANAATTNPTTAQLFEEKNMRPGTVAESTFAPTSASVVSTPGQEFPGAYPNKQEAKPVGSEIAETVTGTANSFAQSVSETAQTYVPAAAEMIGQYLPKSVTDKMSEYIPGMTNPQGAVKASENDIAHDKSLPSTELTGAGAREHVGGVGALPGSLAESSVTKLPDERANTAIPATVAGAAVAATEVAKGTAEKVQNTAYDAKDRVTHGGHTTAIGASSVPSRELDGAKPGDHSSGVGALPGSINEPGVARLPDEKGRGITGATSASVGTHSKTFGAAILPSQDDSTHGVSGGVGALPGLKDESGVALLPDERPSRETGTNFSQSTPSKVGETAHIAEVARQEGIRSSQAQSQQPITKQEKKEEGKAGAAAVGAAVGEKFAKDEHAKDSEKNISSGIPNKGDTYETDYHPADLHPAEADYSKEHKEQAREAAGEKEQEKPLTGAKHADSKQASHAEGTGSATDDTEKAKKVGFMTKMKGEAKILLGKVEGKKGHDKVEEGQKIKAGEATTAQ